MGTGSFRGVKRPGRGADPTSSTEVGSTLVLYLFFPSLLAQVCRGLTFTFTDNIFHVFYSSDLSIVFSKPKARWHASSQRPECCSYKLRWPSTGRCSRNLLVLEDLFLCQTSACRAGFRANVAQNLEFRMAAIFVKVLEINCKWENLSFFIAFDVVFLSSFKNVP